MSTNILDELALKHWHVFTKVCGVISQNTIFLLLFDSKLCNVIEFITRSWFRFVLLFRILLASWIRPSSCSLIQQHFSDRHYLTIFLLNSVWTSCHSPVGDRAPPSATDHFIFSGQRYGLLCWACLVESSIRWGAHKGMVTSDTVYECTRIINYVWRSVVEQKSGCINTLGMKLWL